MSGSLWKISLFCCEKMNLRKAENILVLLWKVLTSLSHGRGLSTSGSSDHTLRTTVSENLWSHFHLEKKWVLLNSSLLYIFGWYDPDGTKLLGSWSTGFEKRSPHYKWVGASLPLVLCPYTPWFFFSVFQLLGFWPGNMSRHRATPRHHKCVPPQ